MRLGTTRYPFPLLATRYPLPNMETNFTLKELCATRTGLPNTPPPEAAARLEALVRHVLQPARDALGMPVRVTSGYRSPAVNRAVGGVPRSPHLRGEAADLVCADNARLFHTLRRITPFDQLIWEGGDHRQPAWVHVSHRPDGRNRGEVVYPPNPLKGARGEK